MRRAARRSYDAGRERGAGGWQNHPLLLASAALAGGAALGFLLPATDREDRLIGPTSDRLMGRFKKAGKQAIDLGRRAVLDAVETTAREAQREGLTPNQLGRKVKRIAAHLRDAIADAVE